MSSFFEIDFKKAQNYIEFQKEKNKDTMFNLKTKNNHEIKMQNSYQRMSNISKKKQNSIQKYFYPKNHSWIFIKLNFLSFEEKKFQIFFMF